MKAVLLDTETTDAKSPALIEAAWLELADPTTLGVVSSFAGLFNPGKPISPAAMAVHHIIPEELAGKPGPETFRLPEGTAFIIGHNIDFDWRVIGEPDVRRIDTVALARLAWPTGVDSYGLSALLYQFLGTGQRDRLRGAHRAPQDVANNLALLRLLVDRLRPVADWMALWELSEQGRIPKVMPFGKHQGVPIAQVPADYKAWLLRQDDVDPYLRKALGGR